MSFNTNAVILLSLCILSTRALKLQLIPEFDEDSGDHFDEGNSTYDEDCGDRNNHECWAPGGHGLDLRNPAYITTIAWAAGFTAANQGLARKPSVVVTFDKPVDVSACAGAASTTTPSLKVTNSDGTTHATCECASGSGTSQLTFTAATGIDVTSTEVLSVAADSITIDPLKTIKNKGKTRPAHVTHAVTALSITVGCPAATILTYALADGDCLGTLETTFTITDHTTPPAYVLCGGDKINTLGTSLGAASCFNSDTDLLTVVNENWDGDVAIRLWCDSTNMKQAGCTGADCVSCANEATTTIFADKAADACQLSEHSVGASKKYWKANFAIPDCPR